jgi:DNA-binding transcriptional LysR family regulator
MFDWDDIRIFIAAARAGSLSLAGQRLGIDAATVGRRLARLETALKSTLVVRSPSGLALTAAGAQLLETTRAAEVAMEAAESVARLDPISGTVRISAAEGFGGVVLAPALPRLLSDHPGLNVELVANSGFLSASRREVDMAITLSPVPSPRLIVEPLTEYQLGLYAAPDHPAAIAQSLSVQDLGQFDFVGYIDDLIYAPELNYLDEISPGLRPRMAISSIRAQKDVIASGGGIGIIPCFMAHGLTRLIPEQIHINRHFWLHTHRELHSTSRMKAVRRWLTSVTHDSRSELSPF